MGLSKTFAEKLQLAFAVVGLKLQEAATELSHDNIRQRISDTIRDHYRDKQMWCYLVDVFGDDQSGYCVFAVDGDLQKANYEIGNLGQKTTCTVDCENAVDVVPRTTYEEEAEDEDHYTAMETAKLYKSKTEFPLYERFISKDERKSAGAGSFAGKGKSFPILKPADVMAAVRSIGRAGADNYDAGTLKKNIVRIAKAKGFASELPKAWRDGGDTAEARRLELVDGETELRESALFTEAIRVAEGARADYPVRIITPGWGSTGYYPAAVLERDGPKIFKSGTHMYWNHATESEETQRPEGDLNNLAAVLTSDAAWDAQGKEGAGLYARAKVFSDYAEKVAEKASSTGLSIRAAGTGKMGEAEGKKGLIIESLTHGESVDFVTKPGRGGKVLTESARVDAEIQLEGAADMDAAELKALQESVRISAATARKANQRLAQFEARDAVAKLLEGVQLPAPTKARLLERCIGMAPITTEGELDTAGLTKIVETEVKEEAAYLSRLAESNGGIVRNMGGAPAVETDPVKAAEADSKAFEAGMGELADTLGISEKQRKIFTEGRGAA